MWSRLQLHNIYNGYVIQLGRIPDDSIYPIVILSRFCGVGDQKEEFIESSLMGKMTFPLLKQGYMTSLPRQRLYDFPTSSEALFPTIV